MSRQFLLVTPHYAPFVGGTATFVEAMAQRLTCAGNRVTVLTTNARRASDFWLSARQRQAAALQEEIAVEGALLEGENVVRLAVRYPRPAPYAFGVARRAGHWLGSSPVPRWLQRPLLMGLANWMPPLVGLEQALARLVAGADLVHAIEGSWDGLFVKTAAAAAAFGKPYVAMPLMHLGDAHVRAHFQMTHQVDAYRRADAVLALSQQERIAYIRLGVDATRIHLISMGVAPLQQADDAGAAAIFRQRFDLQGPIVAFLGANTYDKGAFTLALAAAQLAAAGSPVTVVYAGPESAGLMEFLARQPVDIRSRLQDRVRILGPVDAQIKHQLLAACDLLALPSQVDTFGIVLLEAWLHGKPVIGARTGGIPDLVRDGQDGLLTPFGDVSALAAALRQLAFDPGLAARLGSAGRERVLQDYTWDRTHQTLCGVYDAVLDATDHHAYRLHRP